MASFGGKLCVLQQILRKSGPNRLRSRHNGIASCSQIFRDYSDGAFSGKSVRIGCASGFWGDTAVSAPQLIHKGNLDFLVFDYLSEITMSLLTAAKQRMPEFGYAPDFVQTAIGPYLKDIKTRGIRVISNAGGVNPHSCAAALAASAKKAGVELNIAVVTGDDLMSQKEILLKAGVKEMVSDMTLPASTTSMTAYLGAGGIQRALDLGADIVVTGRCTDSALALAPLMHTFKWAPDNFDLLAAGSLAGHLIECGAQSTGGVFTDWVNVKDWDNIGFPIVEVSADGKFLLTKPAKTGGLVSPATVAEQLVYEIGDPENYILPDVVCDFSHVQFTTIPGYDGEAVYVQGAQGKPPTADYKVSATYADGYRLTSVCVLGGPRSAAKGRKTAEAILKRARGAFKTLGMDDFTDQHVQMIGAEESYGENATEGPGPREGVLWMAVTHKDKKALQLLSREIAPAGTGMAPGLCSIVGGRPKVSPVLKLFSFLQPKDTFKIQIHMNGKTEEYSPPKVKTGSSPPIKHTSDESESPKLPSGSHSYRLEELAYARSGDKGNNCNIGVIARHPSYVPYLRQALTPEAVQTYMRHVFEEHRVPVEDQVQRFELPGINGFNFLLKNSLGGGGIASLRSDPQGKAFAQMLLDFQISDVPNLIEQKSKVVTTN